jgi:hypothetical protein
MRSALIGIAVLLLLLSLVCALTADGVESSRKQLEAVALNGTASTGAAAAASGISRSTVPPEGALCKCFLALVHLLTCSALSSC